jgi:hypothetical protein
LGLSRSRKKTWGTPLKDGFYQPFLYWATRYLKITSVDHVFETNQSVVELIANKISQRQRESHLKLNKAKRQAKVLNQSKIQEQAIEQANKQDKDMGKPPPEGWKHTVTIKEARANSIDFHLRDRGIIFHIPYNKQDMEALRSQGEIEVVLTVHFVEHQQNDLDKSFSYCAPHAQRHDPAYGMQIKCTYHVEKDGISARRKFWTTRRETGRKRENLSHKRLCQMTTVADCWNGKTTEYVLSQPHRFLQNQRGTNSGRLRGKHYTICNEASCEGCPRIKAKE